MLICRTRGRRTQPAKAECYLLQYRASDGYTEDFRTSDIKAASAWAQEKLGKQVEAGDSYAVSFDGIGRLSFFSVAPDGTILKNLGALGHRLLWPPQLSPRDVPPSADRKAVQELRVALQRAVEEYLKRVRWTKPEKSVRCAGTWHISWSGDKDPEVWSMLKAMPEVREPQSRVWECSDPNETRRNHQTGKREPMFVRFGKDITFDVDEMPAVYKPCARAAPRSTAGLVVNRTYVYESSGSALAFPHAGGRVLFRSEGSYNSSVRFSDDRDEQTSLMARYWGDGAAAHLLRSAGLHVNVRASYRPEAE